MSVHSRAAPPVARGAWRGAVRRAFRACLPMSTSCRLLLAIELAEPAAAAATLPVEQAAGLVDAIATDLVRLLPGIEDAGLVLAAALYDPAELLRPGWPLYAQIERHYRREHDARAAPQLVALGSSAGRMASASLEPEAALDGGALRVLPIVLVADAPRIATLDAALERELEARGLAGAVTAWYVARAFALEVAHARYLSAMDLCAMTALQLEHAGLAALLAPAAGESSEVVRGFPWRYGDGRVRAELAGYRGWLERAGRTLAAAERGEAWLRDSLDTRRAAATLAAHGVTTEWHAVEDIVLDGAVLIEREPVAAPHGVLAAYLHEAPGLGLVAASVVDATGQVLANAYPTPGATRSALLDALARGLGQAITRVRHGPLAFDGEATRLVVPA